MSPERISSVGPDQSIPKSDVETKVESIYRSFGFQGRGELKALGSFDFDKLPDYKLHDVRKSLARVLLATTIKAISVGLTEKRFDPKEFYGWYKSLTSGTGVPQLPPSRDANLDTKIDPKTLEKMQKRHKANPSNASFLTKKGLRDLPDPLRHILKSSGMLLLTIQDETLSEYKEKLEEEGIGRSDRAKAIRRLAEIKKDGVKPQEDGKLISLVVEKDKRNKPEKSQQKVVYQPFLPIFDQLLVDFDNSERERYKKGSEARKALAEKYYGSLSVPEKIAMSPSIATQCFRKVGYYYLGFEPQPSTPESILARLIGTGLHNQLRIVSYQMDKSILLAEMAVPPVLDEDTEFRGRLDLLHKNPVTKVSDIIDHKSVHPFVFSKISREGLPDYLKGTKFYAPSHESEIQLLSYIYEMDKKYPGLNIQSGRVIYIDVETKKRKEAIVPWDAVSKWKFERFLETKRKSEQKILRGELPADPDELPKESFQCSRCEFLIQCPPGQVIAAEKIKRRVRGKPPRSVYIMAQQQREERERTMKNFHVTQERLSITDLTPKSS